MQNFKQYTQLNEAKVTMSKLKPGLKVDVIHSGRSARNYGVRDENVYQGKVQVLGLGIVPFKTSANKRHVIGSDYKDVQKKYNTIWKSDDFRYGQYWNSLDKMKHFFGLISQEDRKYKPGFVCWLWQVIDGPNKGVVDYCYISSDDKWEVTFLNKSTEFVLES
tara:strand:+ start:831 stop:1319 length:489 start_codon:yes stop_codon:yes gene_type:complete